MKKNIFTFVMPWHISERGGGAEVQANYLAQELAKRGFQISYVCQTLQVNRINTIETIESIKVYWLKPSSRFQWLDQNKYLKPLHSIRPNVIVQRLSSNVTSVIGEYAYKNNCKFVWICTDNTNPYKDFHQKRFKNKYQLKNTGFIKYNVFLLNARVMDYYRNKGMKRVNVAFSQNKEQKQALFTQFKLPSKKMISGHPLPQMALTVQQRFKKQTILWCANFGQNKRPELFIELAKQIQKQDFNLKLVMVGGHSDTSYVNNILREQPHNLTITGQLSFKDALRYFDESTIFVNTSLSEGFSNTYIQAWLRGVPTVVFGSDPDQIIKDNGLGISVSTVDEAIVYIQNLLINFELYKNISEHVTSFSKEYHSLKAMTDNFLNKTFNN